MMSIEKARLSYLQSKPGKTQGGYALVAIITFVMIISAMATGGVSLTAKSERLAGNAIQKSRSFLAADGAVKLAVEKLEDLMISNTYANISGTSGIYSPEQRVEEWWRADNATPVATEALHVVDADAVLGVVEPPRFVIEQIGDYVSDGGTNVVNLDIGGADYGRVTASGREFLLFSVESHGKGSFDTVDTVIESTLSFSY